MTTKEAIEYIVSTTREYRDRNEANDAEGCAEILMRWGEWKAKNGIALMEAAAGPHDKPAVIAALWSDTIGSLIMALEALGPYSMPVVGLMRACFAFAEEAEKYATPQD